MDVPVIVDEVMVPEVERVIKPLKLALARAATWPVKDSVGSPEMPSPLLTESPVVPLAIERLVSVVPSVLTWMPALELTKDSRAPVVLILNRPWAPPSEMVRPFVAPTYRLFASWGVVTAVR